ncbi:hypothetical protein VTI28DRAFT_8039 [Corynascus sepedonium]
MRAESKGVSLVLQKEGARSEIEFRSLLKLLAGLPHGGGPGESSPWQPFPVRASELALLDDDVAGGAALD